MSINYPVSVDTSTQFPEAETLASGTLGQHATLHGDLGAAVLALEAKVGVNASADTGSLDYKVTAQESGISALQSAVTTLQSAVTTLQGQVSTLQSQIGSFTAGAWTTYASPTVTQNGSVSYTVDYSKYCRQGRQIIYQFALSITGSGSSGQDLFITLPVAAATLGYANRPIGSVYLYDNAGTTPKESIYQAYLQDTTKFGLQRNTWFANNGDTDFGGKNSSNRALANNDKLAGFVIYEAAS